MSRILFVCSGNTCRSPMAAAFAQQVFGPSHTIVSAGAETVDGSEAAAKAISVMKELGADLMSHSTVSIESLTLTNFDCIVIFRPSAAESVPFPSSVRLKFLDIADPIGTGTEVYRRTALRIRRAVRQLYVEDSLQRIKAPGGPARSHLTGIFLKAGKQCELEAAFFASKHLPALVPPKPTLGQLANAIGEYAASLNRKDLSLLSNELSAANDVWKKAKHHQTEPGRAEILRALEAIKRSLALIDNAEPTSMAPPESH